MTLILIFIALIFLSAGNWRWRDGWLFVGLLILNFLLAGIILFLKQPALLAPRGQAGAGTQGWDRFLAPLVVWAPIYIGVVSALGYRFQGTDLVAVWVCVIAVVVYLAGNLLVTLAMLHNPFFEPTVRIQSDQAHRVAGSGPYRWVRHPGYLGALMQNSVMPLIFSVYCGFTGVAVMVIVLIARTAMEDRYLIENLDGYSNFTEQTRFRLIPGLW